MSGRIAMLREILDVLQDDPSSQRRWFHDDYFDLFVRQAGAEVAGLGLCYGIAPQGGAVVWSRGRGYFHGGGVSASGDFMGSRGGSRARMKSRGADIPPSSGAVSVMVRTMRS